ncbi:MAG: hypothetical protein KJ970_15185 [Candidatus Eisenbacteria bacterium]|uniref:STAS/SEC14 domain-containing protein n=1 Tax=Eiseniibacteriota bacterium TaxID=2212470 RepID=A0A948RWQ9_UNCEI|nr:hypothetical protein [Candidatus Eisenbacteria bacterium]MBU1978041.1 hypothetical protein [Gammaproteobacteria bacterium]MBU2692265.1 hypothetical protein [Candidatus Eisenbacteria bacterium]
MSVDLRFDPEKKILYLTVKGRFTLEEFQAAMEKIARSDQYPPDTNALWDLRELDFETIDAGYWRRILEIRKKFPERHTARLAHIVKGDFAFGMLRMYEILSSLDKGGLEQQVRLFKSFSEGEQWLLGK